MDLYVLLRMFKKIKHVFGRNNDVGIVKVFLGGGNHTKRLLHLIKSIDKSKVLVEKYSKNHCIDITDVKHILKSYSLI